jgi:hypothetical protein
MPRRTLTPRVSWSDSYDYVTYVADAIALAAADGDAEVAAIAASIDKVVTAWETLDAERRAKRRAQSRANALVRRRDVQADGIVDALHNDTLAMVKLDRQAPLFKRFFPVPVHLVVRLALGSELPELRKLALKLDDPETPAALKSAHQPPLASIIDQGQKAIEGREQAYADAGRTGARIAAWKEDANAALLGVEGTLKKIAGERRLGADWVEAFFPAPEQAKRKEKRDAEAPAPKPD